MNSYTQLNSLRPLPSAKLRSKYTTNICFYKNATAAYYNTYTSKRGVAVWQDNACIYTKIAAISE